MIIGFLDSNVNRLEILRNWIISYFSSKKFNFEILYFNDNNVSNLIEKYANVLSFAFISTEEDYSLDVGKIISQLNPFCITCYYSKIKLDIVPYLQARPFSYFVGQLDFETLNSVMNSMMYAFGNSRGTFLYNTRSGSLFFPIKAIQFFESDLKYVNIILEPYVINNNSISELNTKICAKLSEIENELTKQNIYGYFVRIHKSYLVNILYIDYVNKKQHTVHLSSGIVLPISEANYQNTLQKIQKYHLPQFDD